MGVLEVKCPFTCKDQSFLNASKERFFLHQQSNGILTLDTNHTYYYQVQAQIELCGAKYCDFVVWREDELHIERIYLNKDFIRNAFDRASTFIKVGVLPELVGKWFSKAPLHQGSTATTDRQNAVSSTVTRSTDGREKKLYCICQQEESGRMIACDNEACPVIWFHVACLKMQRIPKGKWFCEACRRTR